MLLNICVCMCLCGCHYHLNYMKLLNFDTVTQQQVEQKGPSKEKDIFCQLELKCVYEML